MKFVVGEVVEHVERKTRYRIMDAATMQCSGPWDNHPCVIYMSLDDGRLWIRPEKEFLDGRFKGVSNGKQTTQTGEPGNASSASAPGFGSEGNA